MHDQFKNVLAHSALVCHSNSKFQSRLSEITFIPDQISSKVTDKPTTSMTSITSRFSRPQAFGQ